jgi:hypothetical protein
MALCVNNTRSVLRSPGTALLLDLTRLVIDISCSIGEPTDITNVQCCLHSVMFHAPVREEFRKLSDHRPADTNTTTAPGMPKSNVFDLQAFPSFSI